MVDVFREYATDTGLKTEFLDVFHRFAKSDFFVFVYGERTVCDQDEAVLKTSRRFKVEVVFPKGNDLLVLQTGLKSVRACKKFFRFITQLDHLL